MVKEWICGERSVGRHRVKPLVAGERHSRQLSEPIACPSIEAVETTTSTSSEQTGTGWDHSPETPLHPESIDSVRVLCDELPPCRGQMAAPADKWHPWITELGTHIRIEWVLLIGRAISLLISLGTLSSRAWSIKKSRRQSSYDNGPPGFAAFPVRFNSHAHRCLAEYSGAGAASKTVEVSEPGRGPSLGSSKFRR